MSCDVIDVTRLQINTIIKSKVGVVTNSRYLAPYTHPPERERTKIKD